jgi:hypothetical protein
MLNNDRKTKKCHYSSILIWMMLFSLILGACAVSAPESGEHGQVQANENDLDSPDSRIRMGMKINRNPDL